MRADLLSAELAVDVVERLGELLREVGFDGERHTALTGGPGGVPPPGALAALDRPADARLAILLKLFHDGRTVPRAEAAEAIDPMTVEDLLGAGLLETDSSGLRARLGLAVFDGLIVAGDRVHDREDANFVKNIAPASKTTARLTVRRPIATALDLGCGSGIQGLLAARHADRVVGVDFNPRALTFARLNERLNQVDCVNWEEGDWLEPVRGQRFDLVVANPPFVVSPESSILFRDSTDRGDELSRQVVRESAEQLAENGFATVLCNWIHPEDAWDEPLRQWVEGLGCDALLLHFESEESLSYSMFWISETGPTDEAEFAEAVERWLAHHKSLGVERIAWGAIILRRRSAQSTWTRAFHTPGGPSGAGGEHLERIFAGCDFLASRSAAEGFRELLSSPWRLVNGHRLVQTLVHEDGSYVSGDAVIRQDPGLRLYARVDARIVPVLAGMDGERRLGEVIEQTPIPEGLDKRDFHSLCLDTARDLIARGYLVGDAL